MSFSIRPFCRFPICCPLTYHAGPFLKLRLASRLGFWCLITLLALSSGPAYAGWVELFHTDHAALYVDSDTIRREGGLVKLWHLIDAKTMQTEADISYLSMKGQTEYDCIKERSRLLTIMFFSGKMGNGKVLFSSSDERTWVPVNPEGLDKVRWDYACDKK
jgi:hypothetical protein